MILTHNLCASHVLVHTLKSVLTAMTTVFSVRVFLWEHTHQISHLVVWYKFSTAAYALILCAQLVGWLWDMVHQLLWSNAPWARTIKRSLTASESPSPISYALHGLQCGWSVLWAINLTLETLVASHSHYPSNDLSVLLSLHVAQISLLLPTIIGITSSQAASWSRIVRPVGP